MVSLTRRAFIQSSVAAAALPTLASSSAEAAPAITAVKLKWLDTAPVAATGYTVGLPWPRGQVRKDQQFVLRSSAGDVACQTWATATWPDGSLKWSAHALPAGVNLDGELTIAPGLAKRPAMAVNLREHADGIDVDTGVFSCSVARSGSDLIRAMSRGGRQIAGAARLVALCDDQPEGTTRQNSFTSEIARVSVEQRGPVRAVIKIEGQHKGAGRSWLPFTVRLYFYAGAESLRIMHTFIFDGDEQKDFLRGIGLRFSVPLRDPMHDRHVRFGGQDGGQWAEGVRNITGLRRDPGKAVTKAQLAGQACPPLDRCNQQVASALHLVPAWGDYTLAQLTADAFQIRKRTKPGHGWIDAAFGQRAPGVGYIGGASGGVAFGLRDFWQRHPTQLDIRNAHTDAAEVTLWMWSPDARAMDMRFYHDGMGMETHEQERQGLEITYEDYEKGFGTPYGVARSSEITLWALAATPARERLAQMTTAVQTPPQLVAEPAHYLAAKVFGGMWSLPDRSHPVKAAIEDQLDFRLDFYQREVEQRRWYGFWDYGDIRHTYDEDRHEWRYDVGGFAWDNSELSPDLWLWYSFLRTGRAGIFRMAEAMVRHTSEVDIYHLGRFAGLGTRHNVQHWGCSAKQVRISAAVYRRMYYFMTADERVGDIMRELLDADTKLADVDPIRKLPRKANKVWPANISVGTDWGSMAGNWMTEWERGGNPRYRTKLMNGMRDIAAMPKGLFSANPAGYEADSGRLHNIAGDKASASHLSAVFGGMEIFAELIDLTGDPAFEKAWLQYCIMYNASVPDQLRELGNAHGGGRALTVGHSRLTAYAAWRKKDPTLARRAWQEFFGGDSHTPETLKKVTVSGPAVLNRIEEAPGLSTNGTAQWGLAAIQNLALIGKYIPDA